MDPGPARRLLAKRLLTDQMCHTTHHSLEERTRVPGRQLIGDRSLDGRGMAVARPFRDENVEALSQGNDDRREGSRIDAARMDLCKTLALDPLVVPRASGRSPFVSGLAS